VGGSTASGPHPIGLLAKRLSYQFTRVRAVPEFFKKTDGNEEQDFAIAAAGVSEAKNTKIRRVTKVTSRRLQRFLYANLRR
jgi:hypothetical protein